MGTRHLIAVKAGGKYKVAQYGQWDGYPSCQGQTVLEFLRSLTPETWETFHQKVLAAVWVDSEKIEKTLKDFGANDDGTIAIDKHKEWTEVYPQWSRDTGGGILQLIMDKPDGIELSDFLSFAGNSLFCEWAYVIDFDEGTFEVYQGFNKKKTTVKDRFHQFAPSVDEIKKSKQEKDYVYYPVRLKALFYLNALPENDDFLEICDKANWKKPHVAKKVPGSVIKEQIPVAVPEVVAPAVPVAPFTEEEASRPLRDIS